MSKYATLTAMLLLLAGCRSIEGHYRPACAAFEGFTLQLDNGRFELDRFTDMVQVDDDGNVIPAFPGYPLVGIYSVDGEALVLTPDTGASVTMYLAPRDDTVYVLDEAGYGRFRAGGEFPSCALVRESTVSD